MDGDPPSPLLLAVGTWLVLVNLFAFVQMGWDKRCAHRQQRRISEVQLVAPVCVGALPGLLLGMAVFRHKTVKRGFHLKVGAAAMVFSLAVYGLWHLAARGLSPLAGL